MLCFFHILNIIKSCVNVVSRSLRPRHPQVLGFLGGFQEEDATLGQMGPRRVVRFRSGDSIPESPKTAFGLFNQDSSEAQIGRPNRRAFRPPARGQTSLPSHGGLPNKNNTHP